MNKILKNVIEFLAAFFGVCLLVTFLIVWRVSAHPITSTALTPYVESALGYLIPDSHITIGKTLIVWDNEERSIAIQGDDVKVYNLQNDFIGQSKNLSVKLSLRALLFGRFIPAELKADHTELRLVHRADGELAFAGMATSNNQPSVKNEGGVSSFKYQMKDFLAKLVNQNSLQDLIVSNAVLSIHDEKTNHDSLISAPDISLHYLGKNLIGQAHIEVAQKDQTALVYAHYDFNAHDKQHNFSLRFSDINPSLFAQHNPLLSSLAMMNVPLTGSIDLSVDPSVNVVRGDVGIDGGAGTIIDADVWDNPLKINSARIEANYDGKMQAFKIGALQFDLDGTKLDVSLDANPIKDAAKDQTGKNAGALDFVANAHLTNLPLDKYAAVWPKSFITNARAWIASNMTKGSFDSADVVIKGNFLWSDIANANLVSVAGKMAANHVTINYIDGMTPVENVGAQATFDLEHMDVSITGGNAGAIALLPSTIQLNDFQKDTQTAIIPVKLSGSVKDVLKLIDQKPLEYAKAIGLKPEENDGRVDGTVELSFPLLSTLSLNDIGVKANAHLTNLSMPTLISGFVLSHGTMDLNLDKNGFTLNGPVAFNKVPLQANVIGRFAKVVGKPMYEGDVMGVVAGEQWPLLGLITGIGVTGATTAKMHFAIPQKSLVQLNAELNLQQAALNVVMLNWKKPAGFPAMLTFAVDLKDGKDIQVKNILLSGRDAFVKGTAVLDHGNQQLIALDLTPVKAGRNNANLHFFQSQLANGESRITADGVSVDISAIKSDSKRKAATEAAATPIDYRVKLQKLYTSDNGFIADIEGHARHDAEGWDVIDIHGMAEGSHMLNVQLLPHDNIRTFDLTCDDFGEALKGAGFTDTVHGGVLSIKGQSSADAPRTIMGSVKIDSFFVSGLPVLARLINLSSPFGFADLIMGETSFGHLAGDFRWHGDQIEFMKTRAAGSVLGVNVDGRLDMNNGDANLNGTLVPFSFFNSIINQIPLLGNVITGGEGQGVIAVAYTVKGPLSNPDVSVNPVSLLTPGFLRNLFFAGDDTTADASTDGQ